jgi:hypothetical protein
MAGQTGVPLSHQRSLPPHWGRLASTRTQGESRRRQATSPPGVLRSPHPEAGALVCERPRSAETAWPGAYPFVKSGRLVTEAPPGTGPQRPRHLPADATGDYRATTGLPAELPRLLATLRDGTRPFAKRPPEA